MIRDSLIPIFLICLFSGCSEREHVVRIAVTTDVHGMIFPHDFIRGEKAGHSLAHVHAYAEERRKSRDTAFFLLDNGDFLQGQPPVYYHNYVDTLQIHLAARVMNYMGYACGTVGNHDIETGPGVYDKIRGELNFPWLAANAVDVATGEPRFEPYTLLKTGNYRIAVLGLITPGIPRWLPKNLWPGMEFRDMIQTAGKWVPRIIEKEKPDLVVGLFHSGTDATYGSSPGPYLNENAALLVAEQVPGFDVIFAGHDHRVSVQRVVNVAGDSVLVVDPGSHGRYAGEITIAFTRDGKRLTGARNIPMEGYIPSPEFLERFKVDRERVSTYLADTITWLSESMHGAEALFGPSMMMTLVHRVQLELSGAQVSFTAPLSLGSALDAGPLNVSDMFRLYRFENMLYTMRLSGEEIDGFLEHAAGIWFNTMEDSSDHLLNFRKGEPGSLAHPYYHFSSAAGIDYTIDVSKKPGKRVEISRLTGGSPFNPSDTFLVAVNSYRGNGGGGHLTGGAGIPAEELTDRVAWSSDTDIRYLMMQYLAAHDTITPRTSRNWHCIPREWVFSAAGKDRGYFF